MSENNTPQKGNDSIQEMLQRLLRSVSDLSGMPEELKSKDPRANDTAAGQPQADGTPTAAAENGASPAEDTEITETSEAPDASEESEVDESVIARFFTTVPDEPAPAAEEEPPKKAHPARAAGKAPVKEKSARRRTPIARAALDDEEDGDLPDVSVSDFADALMVHPAPDAPPEPEKQDFSYLSAKEKETAAPYVPAAAEEPEAPPAPSVDIPLPSFDRPPVRVGADATAQNAEEESPAAPVAPVPAPEEAADEPPAPIPPVMHTEITDREAEALFQSPRPDADEERRYREHRRAVREGRDEEGETVEPNDENGFSVEVEVRPTVPPAPPEPPRPTPKAEVPVEETPAVPIPEEEPSIPADVLEDDGIEEADYAGSFSYLLGRRAQKRAPSPPEERPRVPAAPEEDVQGRREKLVSEEPTTGEQLTFDFLSGRAEGNAEPAPADRRVPPMPAEPLWDVPEPAVPVPPQDAPAGDTTDKADPGPIDWGSPREEQPAPIDWGSPAEETPAPIDWGTPAEEPPAPVDWGAPAEETPAPKADPSAGEKAEPSAEPPRPFAADDRRAAAPEKPKAARRPKKERREKKLPHHPDERTAQEGEAAVEDYTSRDQIDVLSGKFTAALGRNTVRIIALAFLFAVLMVLENAPLVHLPLPGLFARTSVALACNMLAVTLALLASFPSLAYAWRQLMVGRVSSELFLSISLLLTLLYDLLVYLMSLPSFLPLGTVSALGALVMAISDRKKETADYAAFRFLASAGDKLAASLRKAPAADIDETMTEARTFSAKKVGFTTGFFRRIRHNCEDSRKNLWLLPAALAAAVAAAIITGVRTGTPALALYAFVLTALAALPAAWATLHKFSYARLSRRASACRCTVAGEASAWEYGETEVAVFEDAEAFPASLARVRRMKLYGEYAQSLDRVLYRVCGALSVVGGPLDGVFRPSTAELGVSSDTALVRAAEDGFVAAVDGHEIAIGRGDYMLRSGVKMYYDAEDEEQIAAGKTTILFAADNGRLMAKFYITYKLDEDFEKDVERLYKNGIRSVLRTYDPNIREDLVNKIGYIAPYGVKVRHKTASELNDMALPRLDSGLVSKSSPRDMLKTVLACRHTRRLIQGLEWGAFVASCACMVAAVTLAAVGMLTTLPALVWTGAHLFGVLAVALIVKIHG